MGSVMVLNGQFCCFVEAVRLFCNGVRVGSCGFLQCKLTFRLRGVEQNASYSMGSSASIRCKREGWRHHIGGSLGVSGNAVSRKRHLFYFPGLGHCPVSENKTETDFIAHL